MDQPAIVGNLVARAVKAAGARKVGIDTSPVAQTFARAFGRRPASELFPTSWTPDHRRVPSVIRVVRTCRSAVKTLPRPWPACSPDRPGPRRRGAAILDNVLRTRSARWPVVCHIFTAMSVRHSGGNGVQADASILDGGRPPTSAEISERRTGGGNAQRLPRQRRQGSNRRRALTVPTLARGSAGTCVTPARSTMPATSPVEPGDLS